jgi:hypothetical protein
MFRVRPDYGLNYMATDKKAETRDIQLQLQASLALNFKVAAEKDGRT